MFWRASVLVGIVAVAAFEFLRPLDYLALRSKIIIERDQIRQKYDFIVVGGGTAGSIVAARLTELPNVTVLVLEAGHDDHDFPETRWLPMFMNLQQGPFDWQYKTVPQRNCCQSLVDNISFWPRGKGLGGCSSLHGALLVRGTRHDYDQWNSEFDGKGGWGYEDVLPYFKKIEDVSPMMEQVFNSADPKAREFRGFDGPAVITELPMSRMGEMFRDAFQRMGYKWLTDYNGAEQEGFGRCQRTRHPDGRRVSTSETYLRPAARLRPDRLHVLTKAHVTKILFDQGSGSAPLVSRAIGVQYVHENAVHEVHARAEVVISGGAVNTPQLLMLSGIGPAEHLKEHGVPVIVDNSAVGQNLLDHPFTHFSGTVNASLPTEPLADLNDPIQLALAKAKAYLFGSGPFTQNVVEWTAFLRSGVTNEKSPDLQAYLISAPMNRRYKLYNLNEKAIEAMEPKELYQPGRYNFVTMIMLLKPHNAGEIRLRSSNPFDHPLIDPKYLQNELDPDIMAMGLKIHVNLVNSEHLKKYDPRIVNRHAPGCEHLKLLSDEYLKCHARSTTTTMYHPIGTCRMGKKGRNSVVDERLRVHGLANLRIVDASVFPYHIAANTNAATMMIGEKGADMMKEDFVARNKQDIFA